MNKRKGGIHTKNSKSTSKMKLPRVTQPFLKEKMKK